MHRIYYRTTREGAAPEPMYKNGIYAGMEVIDEKSEGFFETNIYCSYKFADESGSRQKISKAAEGSAYGNMQSVSGTTKNVEMTEKVMKEITKVFQNRISETDQKQFLKWKMYQYKPKETNKSKETRAGKISIYKGQTYTNTG